jgi:V8-like Glu-specific endopeptidase
MLKSRSRLWPIVAFLALAACAEHDVEPSATDESPKVVGADERVEVRGSGESVPFRYRPLLDAFGRLSTPAFHAVGVTWPGQRCTATHVGDGVVVTAGHCFHAPSWRKEGACSAGTTIDWGYRTGGAPYLRSRCVSILAMQQGGRSEDRFLDYAIFRVDPAPRATVRVARNAPAHLGLTVFSYPDSTASLFWSPPLTCRQAINPSFLGTLFHTCDTESGSSGASLLADGTLEIVALHGGAEYGTDWNYATRIDSTPLREFLP